MSKNNRLLMVLVAFLSGLAILYVVWFIRYRAIFITGMDGIRWEYLGNGKSRICYRFKTLVGPCYLEIAETDRFIYGGDWQSFWFAIDKENKCVFKAGKIEDLCDKTKEKFVFFYGGDDYGSPRLMDFYTRKNIERFGCVDGHY